MSKAMSSEVVMFSGSADDNPIAMTIYAPIGIDLAIQRLTPSEAAEFGEEPIQILEGLRYEYELSVPGYSLIEESGGGIVSPSSNPRLAHCGTLVTGLNTGKLILLVLNNAGAFCGSTSIEIRPRKLGHRDHYRLMLEDITEACVGLAMELRAPTSMKVAPSPGNSSSTIHQRFSFLRALINSRSFRDALHRISTHPHIRWEAEERIIDVRRGFRANAKTMREIAKAPRRVPVPSSHSLAAAIRSVPERISTCRSAQTNDTEENRFVKFVLEKFVAFLRRMGRKLEELAADKARRGLKKSEADSRLRIQILALESNLVRSLNADIFRNLPELNTLPLRSTVLHRKEGYRELFQAWLKFDMAARLTWNGGDDVYGAGQRDIATLYEYWVFFKLLSIVSSYFDWTTPLVETLMEQTDDGFGIKLKSGKHLAFDATRVIGGRSLSVQFSYNRPFGKDSQRDVAGSWTEGMRPDYTLSLWPSELRAGEAERQDMMVHVHFDAKYRIDDLQEIFGKESGIYQDEASGLGSGRYKRDDLLKMHAYRDAIRRTYGAYVLYPGDAQKGWRKFNEILPGLGAFPLQPGSSDTAIKKFINNVVQHACDRATQREQSDFHTYRIFNTTKPIQIHSQLPELDEKTGERLPPLAEINVLIGSTQSSDHYNWMLKAGIYIYCIEPTGTALRINPKISLAEYVLICMPGFFPSTSFVKVRENGTQLFTAAMLRAMGCPGIIDDALYLAFDIEEAPTFSRYKWEISTIEMPTILTLDALISSCLRQ
ncbi:DUF2357 domain-containing protein [Alcaligenaceae bacterium CGII-47]|nr:DUF2357 domain-containing protein [Alcaligenaceae bacterium CGII-47]